MMNEYPVAASSTQYEFAAAQSALLTDESLRSLDEPALVRAGAASACNGRPGSLWGLDERMTNGGKA